MSAVDEGYGLFLLLLQFRGPKMTLTDRCSRQPEAIGVESMHCQDEANERPPPRPQWAAPRALPNLT